MLRTDHLDETYQRLYDTGPEFDGWLSNHGPMAADALARIGHGHAVEHWLAGYIARLEERPRQRQPIDPAEWRDAFGDHRRLGDWTAYFEHEIDDRPWRDVLAVWWPRVLPGAIAAASHGLIRTGHAIRALGEDDTHPRRMELAQGLGYWAARWQPLPESACVPAFTQAAVATDEIPAALDDLVDTTVTRYAERGQARPVMLVHASTAPRAAALAITALPRDLWIPTYQVARSVVLALTSSYAATSPAPPREDPVALDEAELVAAIASQGDEHGLKFTEVALESSARGNPTALTAIARALEWLAE